PHCLRRQREGTIKSRQLACVTARTLFVFALPTQLGAQHSRYRLIEIGTFGGLTSYDDINGFSAGHSVASAILRGPLGAAGNAHRRQRIFFVVTVDPVEIVVPRTREADHFPRHHVAIAAVDGVGEESHLYVLHHLFEECLSIDVSRASALRSR